MIFGIIKSFFSIGSVVFRILTIIFSAILIWLALVYLNNKIGILKPFASLLGLLFKGIKSALSLVGIG